MRCNKSIVRCFVRSSLISPTLRHKSLRLGKERHYMIYRHLADNLQEIRIKNHIIVEFQSYLWNRYINEAIVMAIKGPSPEMFDDAISYSNVNN